MLVGLATWLVAGAALPQAPPQGARVVVVARDLPVGHRIVPADLHVSRWPEDLRPRAGYARVDAAVGAVLAGPITAGEALTTGRLRGSSLLDALPHGRVMAHIPLADGGLARALRPGDRVDAISTTDGTVIGRDLLVLAAGGEQPDHGALSPLTSDDAVQGPGVMVATQPSTASRLAVAQGAQTPGVGVMLTVHRPG